ncbi:hypothetical protein B0H13DRAFT_2365377 [Mycena leptocephala]|nr:hypothetical protein B0H13DRAFT_2365377 [Mycena leptocephala]
MCPCLPPLLGSNSDRTQKKDKHKKTKRPPKNQELSVFDMCLDMICHATEQPPITIDQFKERWAAQSQSAASTAEMEDTALADLFHGYAHTNEGEHELVFQQEWHEQLDNDLSIVNTNANLQNHNAAFQTTDTQRQSLVQKDIAFKALFINDPAFSVFFEGTKPTIASTKIDESYAEEFQRWSKTFCQYQLIPRNKLAQLYRQCGSQLLLDLFWTAAHLVESCLTSDFLKLWEVLCNHMPVNTANMPLPDAYFKSNRGATLGVVCALHTKLTHYTHLLIKHCPCLLAEAIIALHEQAGDKNASEGDT